MFCAGTIPIKIRWTPAGCDGYDPELRVYNVDAETHTSLTIDPGQTLDAEIGADRRCIGYYEDSTNYAPCPDRNTLETGSQCEDCEERDFLRPFVFGADHFSTGGDEFFESPFYVYLVQFGDLTKVGICHEDRYPLRCIDQGADECTLIYEADDAKRALEVEERIRERTSIPDRATARTKIDQLDEPASASAFADAKAKIRQQTGLELRDTERRRLTDRYLCPADINPRPELVGRNEYLTLNESVAAVKGQLVFTDSGRAIDVTSLEGRVVETRSQRGLDAFS